MANLDDAIAAISQRQRQRQRNVDAASRGIYFYWGRTIDRGRWL